MLVKEFFADTYQVVGVMDGEECPSAEFLLQGEESTRGTREALSETLRQVSMHGLQEAWVKPVNKTHKIFEFKKGKLRLFFFHGVDRQIVVCTTGVIKKTQKADKKAVATAIRYRNDYQRAVDAGQVEVISDEDE